MCDRFSPPTEEEKQADGYEDAQDKEMDERAIGSHFEDQTMCYEDSMECEEYLCDCCGEYASECRCGEMLDMID